MALGEGWCRAPSPPAAGSSDGVVTQQCGSGVAVSWRFPNRVVLAGGHLGGHRQGSESCRPSWLCCVWTRLPVGNEHPRIPSLSHPTVGATVAARFPRESLSFFIEFLFPSHRKSAKEFFLNAYFTASGHLHTVTQNRRLFLKDSQRAASFLQPHRRSAVRCPSSQLSLGVTGHLVSDQVRP